jgi:predicted  nucleic acid-binding Zn-ribbon protein
MSDADDLLCDAYREDSKRLIEVQTALDAARADLAAANARADTLRREAQAELERHRQVGIELQAERDRLQARIDKALAVLAEHWDWKAGRSLHAAMTDALAADTPTTATAEHEGEGHE